MSVSLIVPWRGGDPQREIVWSWCKRHWEYRYPEFELVECDSGDEPFTRGRSINDGVAKSSGEILLLADADTLVANPMGAVGLAERGIWSVAYRQGDYYKLTEKATAVILNRDADWTITEPPREDWAERLTTYSACVAVPRAAFDRIGGYDPAFIGWGYEDIAFWFALDTLWGPLERSTGWAVHLWHPEIAEERLGQPYIAKNKAWFSRYSLAHGNRTTMAQLVRER